MMESSTCAPLPRSFDSALHQLKSAINRKMRTFQSSGTLTAPDLTAAKAANATDIQQRPVYHVP
jgi:hypothetical protein